MIRLLALGPAALTTPSPEGSRSVLAQPKRFALFSYLAIAEPMGYRRRDELLNLFWPDGDTKRSRTSLRKSLHFLRRHLRDTALEVRGDEVRVNPEMVWSDVTAFRAAIDAGQTLRALELYRGDLLEGFHAETSPEFESWMDQTRVQLRRIATGVALEAAELSAASGDLRGASALARRSADLSPFDETVHRRALRVLSEIGDHAGAVRFHERFARRLAEDLEVDPSPETEELLQAIRRRQIAEGDAPYAASLRSGARSQRLAVLPLANLSRDRDQEFFADGLTEELISVLSIVSGLQVIARTSVARYKDTSKSIREVARELGVGSVLEGGVRRAGDQFRVTVRLIDPGTQGQLWAEEYSSAVGDVFDVQGDIARRVSDALKVAVLEGERVQLARQPTTNVAAYDCYLRGRHHFNSRAENGFRRAIDLFREAIDLDPDFALAYAGLAEVYGLAALGFAVIAEAPRLAKDAARKALSLDDALPEAHGVLGYVTAFHDWDLPFADAELTLAVELSPSRAQSLQWHSHVAQMQRDFETAASRMALAHKLDPHSVVIQNERGWAPAFLGDFETARLQHRRAIAMDPEYAMAHYNLGLLYEQEGDLARALDHGTRAVELSNRAPLMVGALGSTLARLGRREEALALVRELEEHSATGPSVWTWTAQVYEALGDVDKALDCLQLGIEAREPVAMLFDTRHFLFRESLSADGRYIALRDEVHRVLGLT